MSEQKEAVFLYMPVLHEGYMRFLLLYTDQPIYLAGKGLTRRYRDIVKDIRAIDPREMKVVLQTLFPGRKVKVVNSEAELTCLNSNEWVVYCPDESVSKDIAELCFPEARLDLDTIFLRWDSENATAQTPVRASTVVDAATFAKRWMQKAYVLSLHSGDWWRQVGAAVLTPSDEVLTAFNSHVPYEQMPYINGDPRASFKKGVQIELTTAMHCELRLVAEAARLGICLDGAELFVTTFPCPWCAKAVAYSGIRRVYYVEGYSVLDAQSILESQGIELVKVTM